MSFSLMSLVVIFILGCFVAGYFVGISNDKPRVLPPPRSKSTELSYQETNSVASLFLEVVALKKEDARWPSLLKRLNPGNEAHVRTLLLEIRQSNSTDPRSALELIEKVCISSKSESDDLSRSDLLERAIAMLLPEKQE
jgi:hypothetical protein